MTVDRPNRRVRLNVAARADVEWWWQFSSQWNGVALMVATDARLLEHMVVSDALGYWRCGATCGREWFQVQWARLGCTQEYGIMAKEMLPIVVAAAVWGQKWAGSLVLARCDNMLVVATVNSGSSREKDTMHLRRCLAFLEARWSCQIKAVHIPGTDNEVADALSHNCADVAYALMQGADKEPVAVQEEVLRAVAGVQPDDGVWDLLWPDSCHRVWPNPRGGHTELAGTGTGVQEGPTAGIGRVFMYVCGIFGAGGVV